MNLAISKQSGSEHDCNLNQLIMDTDTMKKLKAPKIPAKHLNGGDAQLAAEVKYEQEYAAYLIEAQRRKEDSAIARRDARQNEKELYGF